MRVSLFLLFKEVYRLLEPIASVFLPSLKIVNFCYIILRLIEMGSAVIVNVEGAVLRADSTGEKF